MTCIVYAVIWFSNYLDAFDTLKLLTCEQRVSAVVKVEGKTGTLEYCKEYVKH